MTSEFDPGILRRLNQFVTGCSVLAFVFGTWVLIGWMLHIHRMKSILAGQVSVKANTGACFLLIGFAFWVLRKESLPAAAAWKLVARLAAALAAAVGLLSLMEGIWGWDLRIDQLLFAAGPDDIPGSIRPGLMSPITASSFLLLGLALLWLDVKSRRARWIPQLLPCGVAIAAMFGLLDFVLDADTTHTYISPVTALVLFLLACGLILVRTGWGMGALVTSAGIGGTLTRRLLPPAILIPLIIGWLRWKGQSAGLYSDWTGVALMTVICIVLLAGLTAWTGFTVDRGERERRRAQQSVAELASIVTSSNDAIFGVTLDGVVTSWNPGAEAIYGYPVEEMIGQSIAISIPPDRRPDFAAIMERVRSGEPVERYETTPLRKDGRTIHVSISISPVRDRTGRVVGASAIARDITERKLAEEKLHQASLYARSLIEASLDPLVTISKDGQIMDVNRATELATEVERGKLIGSDFCDYFTQPEKARQGYKQVFAEETVQDYPLAIRHASGRVTDVLYNGSVFRNVAGGVEGVFAAARDVTKRKQAEAELQESEAKFRALSDLVPQFVWSCTPDGLNVYFNQRWVEYTGLSLEESYGRGWNTPFHPDDKQTAWAAWNHAVATGDIYRVESRLRAADGSYRWFLMRGVPLRDASGEIVKWFGTCTDIHDLKRAERALRTLSACNEALVRASDEPNLLQRICDLAVSVGGYRMAWVGYAEHDARKTVRPVAQSGVEAGYLDTVDITWADEERGRGPTGTAIRTNLATACRDVTTDARFAPWRENAVRRGYHSSMVLPLKNGEGALGALSIYADEVGTFDEAEQHLLEELANNLGYGIVSLRGRAERQRREEEIRLLNQELEKRVQERTAELRQSENRVLRKLESILSPEGDLEHLELADLLDIPAVQTLAEEFYQLAHIPMFILDLKGNPVVAAGWQEICTRFHRVHPDACQNCRESDLELSTGLAPGQFKLYQCKNHLWDAVTPLMVGEQQVGNLFSGQFFFTDETVDREMFRAQAHKYGFDEQEYLATLDRVPRLSRADVETGMKFYTRLAQLLTHLSYSGIKLARSASQIGRVNAELAASVKELEAFTYSVSHDLRAPLRHISGFSKILTEEFGSDLPPEAQHHLQRIQDGTHRMGMLVDDLLNLARVGRRDLSVQVSGLKSIVGEVIADLAPDGANRQIEWKIGDLPFVDCDPGLMKQVFQNLLSNAVKFTRPRSPAVIEVGQKVQDGTAVVFVRDNGVGFNMKYADKLFGVFQRLHRPEDFEGTGVGLATVQRIIQKHGGRIWVEAELEKGATFYFTLGISEKTETRMQAAKAGGQA